MNEIQLSRLDRRWVWAAAVGLLLFLLIQVFPSAGSLFSSGSSNVLTRSEAEAKAIFWAENKFGLSPKETSDAEITHLSDSDTVGYLSKYRLHDTYDKTWSNSAPTDVYAVSLSSSAYPGKLNLYIDMVKGRLVGWDHVPTKKRTGQASSGEGINESKQSAVARALQYAEYWGANPAEWNPDGYVQDDGSVRFTAASSKAAIGKAAVKLDVRVPASYNALSSAFPPWQSGFVRYGVDLPTDFLHDLKTQQTWSSKLSVFGFLLPSILFFILAIIYAGTYGDRTSFVRGIFLASVFFVLYAGITFNMIPGLRAGNWENGSSTGEQATIIVSLITYFVMAVMTYFSAVGGDGLWKSMGLALWPRWQEAGYGDSVLASMRTGYFLAFILLGMQSVILLAMENIAGSFSSSDATQSMYNMSFPWLLPLLAWCAGISEEMQSRFFGIALFRKWFVGIARKLIGREPSGRTVSALTFVAIVPPGLLWALGHVGYAIYPFYTRIIELVLMSLLFGWFMLRFGIMAVIFAHVTLDAVLMGVQMMFDGLPGDFAAGIFSLAMPGLVGILIWWLHRRLRRPAFRSGT
ncbi:CPBP family intramembrane glutamic endopeptidase [Cohnella soli]|uniref:CAAX prenyl protease 2/Lysostaphin resistance protein A-like domain-containing protein n=1 Tax=Cohnella soli TaxID=425005 RepID=A0ABW0HYF0_9BACL